MRILQTIGEWVVLLPLWRKFIRNRGGQIAAAVATGALWLIIFVAAVSGGGSEDDDGDQVAGDVTDTPTVTGAPPSDATPSDAPLTPAPTAVATPAPTAEPEGIGDGTYTVGVDVQAGTYATSGSALCYFARLSGFGGTIDEIIANNAGTGPQIVTIAATDAGFESSNCGDWILDVGNARSDPTAPFGDGTYFVGREVAAGTWRAEADSCYWARLSGFSGTLSDIIANDNSTGPTVVSIDGSDAGFESSGCGDWTKN